MFDVALRAGANSARPSRESFSVLSSRSIRKRQPNAGGEPQTPARSSRRDLRLGLEGPPGGSALSTSEMFEAWTSAITVRSLMRLS